jgi:hypothetical protein
MSYIGNSPVPYDLMYSWDEDTTSWVEITGET